MTIRIGINGFGRIGRNFFRALYGQRADLEIVAVNDLMPPELLGHLLRYDSASGTFQVEVSSSDTGLQVGSSSIEITAEPNPADIPWRKLGVDIVIEATGLFTNAAVAQQHMTAGAKKVIVSAPSDGADLTIAMGANDQEYDPSRHHVISNASCTTNCLAPLASVVNEAFGIRHGLMTAIHAYTADQNLQDGPHNDLRRARAAALNVVPTSTGAATTIGEVLPSLAGKLEGFAMRVPVAVGSITDLTVSLSQPVTADDINATFQAAANTSRWNGILRYTDEPIVSSDIIGDSSSCIFDSSLTRVVGDQVKVLGWYDNEWGYSNRLLDLTSLVASRLHEMQPK